MAHTPPRGRLPDRHHRFQPTDRADEESQLDWEFGDLAPAALIDVKPSHAADRPQLMPRPSPELLEPREPTVSAAARARTRTASPLASAFRSGDAEARVAMLRRVLDEALDDWWSDNELPSPSLLRDGLLALEAGHDLDEGHRTLLLRAALSHRKGVLTALRYQTDGDRTAFLLKDAVLNVWSPLSPELLWRLRREDEHSGAWAKELARELQDELNVVEGVQHQLAERALAALRSRRPPTPNTGAQSEHGLELVLRPVLLVKDPATWGRYWSPGRAVIVLLVTLLVLIGPMRPGRTAGSGLLSIPGGEYTLATVDANGEQLSSAVTTVTLEAFAIDRTEVTNRNYRQCVLVGECDPPHTPASATRPDYFDNPTYDAHPVVNVTWGGAQQFCRWLGKRLPTADEWTVAASIAPVSGRQFRYPWGDLYEPQLANVRETQIGDTRPVAVDYPKANSPWGAADMAGNVAEWTATSNGDGYVIKGGSFVDGARGVHLAAQQSAPPTSATATIGFRCAADLP